MISNARVAGFWVVAEAQKLTPNIFPLEPKSEHCSAKGPGADWSVYGRSPCLGAAWKRAKRNVAMISPALETCRRKLFDVNSIPKWFGERRECNSGGTGSHVRLQFTRMRTKYLRNVGNCTHEDIRHNTIVLFPSSSRAHVCNFPRSVVVASPCKLQAYMWPQTYTGNLWSARFTVQTWAVKEGLRPAVSFMINDNLHWFGRWGIRQFRFRGFM